MMNSKLGAAFLVFFLSVVAFGGDRTDAILAKFKQDGLTDLATFAVGDVSVRLELAQSARVLLDAKSFDVADPDFDQTKFTAFLTTHFTDGIAYFQKIYPTAPVREVHVILRDFGDERKINAGEAMPGSRVLALDVRRWHKMYKGYRSYLADITSIHEFTHVENYFIDEKEVKQHRELVAVVFEALNYIRAHGEAAFTKRYEGDVAGAAPTADQVLSKKLLPNSVLRYLVSTFFAHAPDRSALEKFAAEYLASQLTGDEGFDAATKTAKMLDSEGNALTYQGLRDELAAAVSKPKEKP